MTLESDRETSDAFDSTP